MASAEWRIAIGGLYALAQVACGESQPQVNPAFSPAPIANTPTPEMSPTPKDASVETPISERRRRGILLETLSFDSSDLKRVGVSVMGQVEYITRLGKIDLINFTPRFDVFIDLKQMLTLINSCGVQSLTENFRVIFVDHLTDNAGNPLKTATEASYRGGDRVIDVKVGLEYLINEVSIGLPNNYEVAAHNTEKASQNLATLGLNGTLANVFCSWVDLVPLYRRNAPEEQKEPALRKGSNMAKTYFEQILNRQTSPSIVIQKASKQLN